MKVHFMGHASFLVEADGVTFLMDPVFWDPHYEGTVASCPRREVYSQALPRYDIVALSHRHLDHFDIRTLTSLDRRCLVLIPDGDPVLLRAIKRLGFDRIQFAEDNRSLTFGGTTITPTPSKANVREVGFVVRDATANIWNAVDTIIDEGIARAVTDTLGPFDTMLFPWQPLLEAEALTNGVTAFPYSIYFKMLSNISVIQPDVAVPSACGYRYVGEGEWLNHFVFPATREMFLRDVSALQIKTRGMTADPGDIVEVRNREVIRHPGASPCVRMVREDARITAFDPTGHIPELADANPEGYATEQMVSAIDAFFKDVFLLVLRDSVERRQIAHEYRTMGLVYQIDVVFPTGPRSWCIDFGRDLCFLEGRSDVWHIHSRIAASALYNLIAGRHSLNYVFGAGLYRYSERVYVSGPQGLRKWTPPAGSSIVDPLWLALDPESLFEKYVEHELTSVGV